jgi:hypothetical protein
VYRVIFAGAAAILLLQSVGAAPISTIDLFPLSPVAAAVYASEAASPVGHPAAVGESPKQSDLVTISEDLLPTRSVAGRSDAGWVELGISGDKSAMQIDPGTCVYPDSYLSNSGSGKDDCRALRPGDDLGFFSLPFFALSGWALAIIAVAGMYRIRRGWRARQRLRHLHDHSLAPQIVSRRAHVTRRSTRSKSRARSRQRSYAS